MARKQIQKQNVQVKQDTYVEETNTDVSNEELAEKTTDVLANIDDVLEDQLDEELLADIDDLLEENAADFVASFVQAGGQ